jgi:hypothetical protein
MVTKAVAAAPEAISEESAKTQLADRPTETQAVVDTTHADGTTVGNAPSVAGEQEKDTEHISPASTDKSTATTPNPSAPEPESAEQSEVLDSNASGALFLVPDTAVPVTLSEPDKVPHAVVPTWTKFADLSIKQKFEQARLMDFEARDAYLRERCRAAKLEVAHAATALNRATEIIESDLPFFLVHFEDMDAQGERSDLRGKGVGKTEWLRQNMPDISKGTFYAALNAAKARYAEQERMMLGIEVPPTPRPKTRTSDLTPIQIEVVTALVGQGFKNNDAILMVKAAEGQDFESLFKSAIRGGAGGGNGSEVTAEADQGKPGNEARPREEGFDESVASRSDAEFPQTPQATQVLANKFHSGNKDDGKHYWLTPPELRELLEAEFGKNLYDPCPYPKPAGFNGLTCDWQKVNYPNIPFGSVIVNGKKVGPTAWIRKAIAEQARGNTTLIPWPMDGWFHMLLAAGVEIRSLGEVKWLAIEDGTQQKGASRKIVLFVLRGATTGADSDSPLKSSPSVEATGAATPVVDKPHMQGDSKDAGLDAEVVASATEFGPEDDFANDEVRSGSEQAIAGKGEESDRAITEARARETAQEAFASKDKGKKKRLDALETYDALSGKPSAELEQLIANPKSHAYALRTLRALLTASLDAEASR